MRATMYTTKKHQTKRQSDRCATSNTPIKTDATRKASQKVKMLVFIYLGGGEGDDLAVSQDGTNYQMLRQASRGVTHTREETSRLILHLTGCRYNCFSYFFCTPPRPY